MQELDFEQLASRPGFRLHTLELYNWGTFNRRIWQLRPQGGTTLLTGANGAGKTTVVDALVTLLTPYQGRHYNQSSGAEARRDRTDRSYLEGAYGTGRDAETGDVAKQVLRPGTGYYSWLAATFWHEALGQGFTIAQYRRFRQGELVTHFLLLPRLFSLQDDEALQGLLSGEPAGWRARLLAEGGGKEYSSFERCAADWQAILNVRSEKALTLFGKTVGMKMLGSLNDFVRREMLSDAGGGLVFQELYDAYRHLLEVFHLLQKAEYQLSLLKPVIDTGGEYRRAQTSADELQTALAALPAVFGQRKVAVLHRVLGQHEQAKAAALAQQQALDAQLEQLVPRISDLEASTRNSDVGQQLRQVAGELRLATERYQQKHTFYQQYKRLAQNAGLPEPVNAAAFAIIQQQAISLLATYQAEATQQEQALLNALQHERQVQEQRRQLAGDLAELGRQASLIPPEMVALRQRLCDALDIGPAQVPFIGELVQVRAEAAHWRPAIEKLLHNVGVHLLVPAQLAARVSRYVHETNLRGRLVYHRVAADQGHRSGELDPASLLPKLEIATKPLFEPWLRSHLYQHYDYCCTDDLARFTAGAEPLLLTSTGLIRTRHRHEKDDRPGKTGARHYVLGWDNQEKLAALTTELQAVEQREATAGALIAQLRQRQSQLTGQQQATSRFLELTSFEQIDWPTQEAECQHLQARQKALEYQRDHDENLRQAQQHLTEARAEEKRLRLLKTQADMTLGAQEKDCRELTEKLRHESAQWPAQPPAVPPGLWLAPPPDPATPDEADEQRASTERRLRTQEADLTRKIQLLGPRLTQAMNRFRRPDALPEAYAAAWQAECTHLLASPDSLADYELLHQRLQEENLPQYQQQFQQYLASDVLQFVFKFRKTLDKQLKDVQASIRELNEALAQIDFSRQPRTYIRLTESEVRDGATQGIAAFRARLRQAMPDQHVLAGGDQAQMLAIFERLQALLDELNRDEATRRKLLDVRNWLVFGAEEVSRADGSVVNVYADSGGRSGGEKAKLAYTVLAAAIAYQYGAMRPGRHQPSFRFVVIDETFSKSDAANSTYALQLFKQLGLQLMIVTPADNIRLAAPFIEQLHLVRRLPTFESEVWNLTLDQYRQGVTVTPAATSASTAATPA